MSGQRGAAAVAAMLLMLAGIAAVGVILDIGLVAIERTRLDHAAEAAARAAARSCPAGAARCLAGTAGRYLDANMPGARLERVRMDPEGRVALRASAAAPQGPGVLWGAPPARLTAEFTVAAGAEGPG